MAKKKRGAPTKYKEEYNDLVYKYCLLGCTDEEMADLFGVSKSTFNLWKKEHIDFSDSVTRGKTIADAEVAAALYNRATGYDYTETKEKEGDNGSETITTTKHISADAGAAMNWLSNRQKKKWRKDPKVKVEVKVNDISDDELQKKIDKLEGKA